MEMILLTGSASSSSDGRSHLSKQCPEIGQTKSPLEGSKTLSRHESSQAEQKKNKKSHTTKMHTKSQGKVRLIVSWQGLIPTMNSSSLLTKKHLSNLRVGTCASRASMIGNHCIGQASAAFPHRHLISDCFVKNYVIVIHLHMSKR